MCFISVVEVAEVAREAEEKEEGTKFNLTACIFGIIGAVAFISLIIACNKGCKNDDDPPEPTHAVYELNRGNLKI